MVALNVLYNVGARDEHPDHTGFAHLFEHLMFGGSVNIPDYDAYVQSAGGENNAWTNNDITNYYITLPRQNVEIGFWLESDRMLSLDFNEKSLEVQRHVVVEEFKQRNLNQPYGDVGHLVRGLVYQKHPYRWPTIGLEPSHIENATLDEVKDFFFRFYAPNNAILAVTGNISFEDTVALAEKWFGPIPRRDVKPRSLPVEPQQTEERRLTVERNVPVDALHLVFHKCDRLHPDYYVFDMLSDLLSAGRSSRLIQHLVVERQVFGSIDAYISGSIDAGMFYVVGKLAPGITLEEAEAAVWQELEAMKTEDIAEEELEKVKNRYESEQIFSNINYLNVATNLAFFELIGQAEDINHEVEKYRAVTAQRIKEVAQRTFVRENCSVLYYKAKKS
jgi:predicted Zn-dependent peptidase